MTDQASSTFSGAIVLKAKTKPETEQLAEQLRWYAEFGQVFANRFEDGYAVRGQVRPIPLPEAGGVASLMARLAAVRQESLVDEPAIVASPADVEIALALLRDQSAQIGRLSEQIVQLTGERDRERDALSHRDQLLSLLSLEEHLHLIDRNIVREHPDLGPAAILVADEHRELRQQLVDELLERVAQQLENEAPDSPHCNQRAADVCAALVRSLKREFV